MTSATTASLTTRRAEDGDCAFLLRVYMTTRGDELAMLPWTEEQKQRFLRQQAEAQDADYRSRWPQDAFRVVVRDGADVGRIYHWTTGDGVQLMDIALLPEWRNQGLGSRLLRDLLDRADAEGLTVSLYVERWNPARRLYARLGFAEVEVGDVYVRMSRRPSAEDGFVPHAVVTGAERHEEQREGVHRVTRDLVGALGQEGLDGSGEHDRELGAGAAIGCLPTGPTAVLDLVETQLDDLVGAVTDAEHLVATGGKRVAREEAGVAHGVTVAEAKERS